MVAILAGGEKRRRKHRVDAKVDRRILETELRNMASRHSIVGDISDWHWIEIQASLDIINIKPSDSDISQSKKQRSERIEKPNIRGRRMTNTIAALLDRRRRSFDITIIRARNSLFHQLSCMYHSLCQWTFVAVLSEIGIFTEIEGSDES